ncbi:TetR/AcrR family transcriptional regulator [Actinomadura barringtoniae]|uniref:TetR/AcrR family transcriptional regulator n=1 Tax=Actinomadura barringtoniae TaxID=1427535 RepID=A0A939PB46_9ACTN|nr:TetR/AcrR family transcriptional regulator [Actinomadura barringtoniae]MBO2449381.1 TetR/AcrR family transcriptional regulator [Actinomadura barringtoniae]
MGRTREFDTDVVVAGAMEVFWRRGYEATSIQDLVEATGIGRGSLYAAFGSKDGLYEEALRRYAGQSTAGLIAQLDRDEPVREVLRDLLMGLVDDTLADPGRKGCLMTNTAVERLPRDAVAGRIVGGAFDTIAEAVTVTLRRARDKGELPQDADVTALADFIVATIQGLRVHGKTGADRRRLGSIVDVALQALPLSG